MVMADRAGVKLALAECDGLVLEVEYWRGQYSQCWSLDSRRSWSSVNMKKTSHLTAYAFTSDVHA
jgi:hypothetical protein